MANELNSAQQLSLSGVPAAPSTYPPASPAWYGTDFEAEESSLPLPHYLLVLKRHRWKILGFVAACTIAAGVISKIITPVYESTATIDIDRRIPAGILGQEGTPSQSLDADQYLATQVKLIQSDSVLRPVAEKYKLFDNATAAAGKGKDAQDAPVELKELKVTRPPSTYLLLISYRSTDPRLSADVANGIANSYILHTYNIRYRSSASLASFMEKQLDELKAKMERSSEALARFERDLNLINPEEKTSILSARLLQLNTDYTNAQTERVRKEAAYNSVKSGTLEAAQVSTQAEALRGLMDKLSDAEEKFEQVRAHYGANHPEYRKAASQLSQIRKQLADSRASTAKRVEIEYQEALNREGMLKKAVAETKSEYDTLNARSFEYQALKHEADADKKLYEELVTRIRQEGINAAFQNSAIRLADAARPAQDPVFPKVALNMLLAFVFSSLLAVGAAILSDAFDTTIRDPGQAERMLNAEVIGSLPLVKGWGKKLRENERRIAISGNGSTALIRRRPRSDESFTNFEDAIRTLRNSILLGHSGRSLRSLLVTSAGPREGKTTTAVHLAITHAQMKHKTLLIDADLRNPAIAQMLGLPADPGLAAVVAHGAWWQERLIQVPHLPGLDVLPAGSATRRTADLLGSVLPEILREAERNYDFVIIDAPPFLGFPEPLQMATTVDGVIVVSLSGETDRKAVGSVLSALQRVRANVVGIVLNQVASGPGNYYYGYYGKA